jgi:hypothetical protein
MKAMHAGIALQSTSGEIHRERIVSFAAAFGVRTRPRIPLVWHR